MFSKGGIDVYFMMGTRVLYACVEFLVVCELCECELWGFCVECEFDIVFLFLFGDVLDMLFLLKDFVMGLGFGLLVIFCSDFDNDLCFLLGCVDFILVC